MDGGKVVVLASDEEVAAAARGVLARGNAVDAVAVGVFAAAGLYPSVLLGPVQLLIGGAGAGRRAVDGRTRQPGLDNPRPRGFRPQDLVPGAARVGVPALPAALLAAVTTYGKLSIAAVLGPGVDLARPRSGRRADVLDRIGQRGPAALAEAQIANELVRQAGRLGGGLLSRQDLAEVRPEFTPATTTPLGGRQVLTVPWGASRVRASSASPMFGANTRVVLAVDRNGLVAIACYDVPPEGLTLDAFDLVAPYTASPVLRGAPRTRPGEPRSAAAPIALCQADGVLDLGAGIGASADAEGSLGEWIRRPVSDLPLEPELPRPPGLVAARRIGAMWSPFA